MVRRQGLRLYLAPKETRSLSSGRPREGLRGPARWTVSLKGKISHFDTQRELSKANRGLFGKRKDEEQGKEKGGEQDKASGKEKDEPSIAFVAVRELLACHAEITELQEKAKQEAASAIEQEASEANYAHPKPEIETLREELDTVKKQLDTVNEQWLLVLAQQDAIALTVEALSKGLGKKMQIAFELLRDDDQWPQDIQKLQEHARLLAAELQWPPSKKELKDIRRLRNVLPCMGGWILRSLPSC